MRIRFKTLIACCAIAVLLEGPASGQDATDPINAPAPGAVIAEFQLEAVDGRSFSLGDDGGDVGTVVIFTGWECPIAKQSVPKVNELQDRFADQGIAWLAVNSNQQDSLTELQAFVRRSGLKIPLLKDPGNRIADQFGATRTPEVFLLDAEHRIRYHGQLDDQFSPGIQRPAPTAHYLADALESLVAKRPIRVAQTEPAGCIIGRVLKPAEANHLESAVTYCNQVSRILQDRCISCHRDGEIGPFALESYDEVAGWAGMIAEVVNDGRMPPWHANPEHGTFSNDCRMTSDEIELINTWVAAGAPRGDESQLPPPREFATGWQIGEPDLIVPMATRPFKVPATGVVEYKYFQVDPEFETDMWVVAAECRPGNRSVIHHIIVGIAGEGEFERRGVHDDVQSDWIAATAPGSPPMILPEGYAKKIPAGSKLVFQMHYTPNGTATTDLSSIGLRFMDEAEVKKQVYTLKAFNPRFEIPAGASNHTVSATFRFDRDAELLSMFPHMHLRGKSFQYAVRFPDGSREILLDVPRYDFNWQNAYQLAQPRWIPKGTNMRCTAHFDNSEQNLANPDPQSTVRWGDQTWEEMMIGYFNVAIDR